MPLDHFGLIAPLYNTQSEYSSREVMLQAADLPINGGLLDVGGGTGRAASALRDKAAQVLVADPSLGMLRFASAKPGLWAAAVCSEDLPFPDNFFQRVIMVDALHHVVDQARTAGELFRVLEPGGRLVIEEPDIRTFGVKLVALAEKALLMRTHFYPPARIISLFPLGKTSLITKDHTVWVVVEK